MKRTTAISVIVIAMIFMGASCEHAVSTSSNETNNGASNPSAKTVTVMFYNVENLFDTENDPATLDDDFTPEGKYNWTNERYELKLQRLSEVISKVNTSLPGIVGLCEIENEKVLNALVNQPALRNAHYSIIHKDSPDERGIDVALLFDPSVFSVEKKEFYEAVLPNENDTRTRDILYVKGKMGGEIIHLFVNHWPSRSGGQVESEHNRIFVANLLRKKIEAIVAVDANAKILCMGDFNDHPLDVSISKTLGAGVDPPSFLFDYMTDDQERKEGSYWYKGEWGPLDQFIGSWSLVNATKGISAGKEAAHILRSEFLFFSDGQGVQRPNRTYAGDAYKGGYSDHLPAYLELSVR